jgi:hypothetical protein
MIAVEHHLHRIIETDTTQVHISRLTGVLLADLGGASYLRQSSFELPIEMSQLVLYGYQGLWLGHKHRGRVEHGHLCRAFAGFVCKCDLGALIKPDSLDPVWSLSAESELEFEVERFYLEVGFQEGLILFDYQTESV